VEWLVNVAQTSCKPGDEDQINLVRTLFREALEGEDWTSALCWTYQAYLGAKQGLPRFLGERPVAHGGERDVPFRRPDNRLSAFALEWMLRIALAYTEIVIPQAELLSVLCRD